MRGEFREFINRPSYMFGPFVTLIRDQNNVNPWGRRLREKCCIILFLAYLMKKYKEIQGFGQGQKFLSDPVVA